MTASSQRFDTLATLLRWFGFFCQLGLVLEVVLLFAVIKLAPRGTNTFPFFGALVMTFGLALGPGFGLPALLTGRVRVNGGLLSGLSAAATGRAPEASGLQVRVLGAVTLVLGLSLALSGLVGFVSAVVNALR